MPAEPVTALLLGAINPMLNLWHARPTDRYAAELENAYMCLVTGALGRLAEQGTGTPAPTPDDDDLTDWVRERIEKASPDQLRRMTHTLVQALRQV